MIPLVWRRMSLERIVRTHNIPATLMTLSLKSRNLTGTALACCFIFNILYSFCFCSFCFILCSSVYSDYSICSFFVRLLCLIIQCLIILYSVLFSVLILELYTRYFDPIIQKEVTCYHHQPSSKSINIIQVQDLHLILTEHRGFWRPIAIIVTSPDMRNQFLRLGSKRARQFICILI
jgi:hypothetical protein